MFAGAVVAIFIVLRRSQILCFNNHFGIFLFALPGIANAGLISPGDGDSLVKVRLKGGRNRRAVYF